MKRFVMLGQRNNKGRIEKNESYTIEEFVNKTCISEIKMDVGLLARIFRWSEVKKKIENAIDFEQTLFIARINRLIEKDNFGRKAK